MTDPERLRSIAEVWRLSRPLTGRVGEIGRIGGIVLIRDGQVCGIRSEMRYAAVEPGVFAVDQDGRVFTAGRFDDGSWPATWIEVGDDRENGKNRTLSVRPVRLRP